MIRYPFGALLFAMVVLTTVGVAHAAVEEAELMAAYLYNFSKFVRWPSHAFVEPSASLVLCVYGRVAALAPLEALNGKSAQGHRIVVDRRLRGDALGDCHLVYVSVSERSYLSPLLRSLSSRPALTVSEIPEFLAAGGMVRLLKVDNRLRFAINTASADAAGLAISSQILKLATEVVRD